MKYVGPLPVELFCLAQCFLTFHCSSLFLNSTVASLSTEFLKLFYPDLSLSFNFHPLDLYLFFSPPSFFLLLPISDFRCDPDVRLLLSCRSSAIWCSRQFFLSSFEEASKAAIAWAIIVIGSCGVVCVIEGGVPSKDPKRPSSFCSDRARD